MCRSSRRPEHTLTVKVASGGMPVEEASSASGPIAPPPTHPGTAAIKLAKGRYELVVWKAGYDTQPTPLDDRRGCLRRMIEARALPQDDPDAVWTA